MELAGKYWEIQTINLITELVTEIYSVKRTSDYKEHADLAYAVDHLFSWRVIPDDLYIKLSAFIMENNKLHIHEIHKHLLEISKRIKK